MIRTVKRNLQPMIVSVDPGLKVCGLAFWRSDSGDNMNMTMRHACLVKNPSPGDWQRMLGAVEEVWDDQGLGGFVVCELPQIYERIKSKGDPNDLVRIGVLVGAIVHSRPHKLYLPAEWKGQTPKSVTEHRARKRLSADELSKFVVPSARSLEHNVWDAVGIGLKYLEDRKLRPVSTVPVSY